MDGWVLLGAGRRLVGPVVWRGWGLEGSRGVRGGAMAVLRAGLRWVGPMIWRGRGL